MEYDIISIDAFHDGLARFKTSEGKYGYLDVNGDVVIEPIYDGASDFNDGIARIKKFGKFGYINTKGKLTIDAIYEEADIFDSDLARVKSNNIEKYINIEGETVYTVTGKEIAIGKISNGFFWVETEKELLSGNIPTIIYYTKDGMAFSVENAHNAGEKSSFDKWGYAIISFANEKGKYNQNRIVSKSGDIITWSDRYLNIQQLYNHYATFFIGGNSTITICLNYKTGEVQSHEHTYFDGGDDWFYLGNEYYYCSRGEKYNLDYYNIILKDDFPVLILDKISAFSNAKIVRVARTEYKGTDYFAVLLLSKSNVFFYSLIDIDGNIIIAPTNECSFMYTYKEIVGSFKETHYAAYSFIGSLCKAQDTETGLFGFIDINGNWVIEPQYQNVTDFFEYGNDAYAVVDDLTIINSKGETVFTAVKA